MGRFGFFGTRAFSKQLIILYSGRFISNMGDWIYAVALTYMLSAQSPIYLTSLWCVKMISPVISNFIAGITIDKIGPKKVAICADILRSLAVIIMPLTLHSLLLFVLIFIVSVLGPFYGIATNPIVTILSTKESRHNVNSILSTLGSTATFMGPLVGGVFVLENSNLPFFINSLSFLFSALSLFFIVLPWKSEFSHEEKKESSFKKFYKEFKMATKFMKQNKIIQYIIQLITFLMLGGSAIDAYEVLFATKTLHIGVAGYGALVSISGASFVFGGLINTFIGRKVKPLILLPVATCFVVLANFIYAFSFGFVTITIALIFLGCGVTTMTASAVTILQEIVPVEKQGRITGLTDVVPQLAATISVVMVGFFLSYFPLRNIYIIEASVMALSLIPAFSLWFLYKNKVR